MIGDSTETAATHQTILQACRWLTASEIAERLHLKSGLALIETWERDGRIFSVLHEGRRLYPSYQFDADCSPKPIVRSILERLVRSRDGWTVGAWFHFPNAWLSNGQHALSPKDALEDGSDAVFAAGNSQNTYIS